ncbi:MAG: sensor histidine kinase [Actinomycetota bacterium]
MVATLLHPWRGGRLWPALAHTALDLPVGMAVTVPTAVLAALTVGLAITLPLAVLPAAGLLVWTGLAAKVERARAAALLGVDIADPVPPLPAGPLWPKVKAALTSGPRWRQVAYGLARLPVGVVLFAAVVTAWAGSFTLMGLPAYASFLPGRTAQLGLLGATQGPLTVALAAVGLAGLVVAAPWLTLAAARTDAALATWLLGPSRERALAERATRAETGRAAAVDAAEAERRRIERDLHDGAQQRLVALAVDLGSARERLDTDPEGAKALVAEAHEEAKAALREIRDLVRGIHPVILEDRGLDAALSAVVARSPVPVELDIELGGRRLPQAVESAAYFVVSEALANVARHARASKAAVSMAVTGDRLVVEVRDDGTGGADPAAGTGLRGLRDRVVALGGTLDILSPPGGPTTVLVELPCAS